MQAFFSFILGHLGLLILLLVGSDLFIIITGVFATNLIAKMPTPEETFDNFKKVVYVFLLVINSVSITFLITIAFMSKVNAFLIVFFGGCVVYAIVSESCDTTMDMFDGLFHEKLENSKRMNPPV